VLIYPDQKKIFDSAATINGVTDLPYHAWVDIGATDDSEKDPYQEDHCAEEKFMRIETRIDFGFCGDTIYTYNDSIHDMMNERGGISSHSVLYHLKGNIAKYINEWTEANKDTDLAYQGIFNDRSVSSLCSVYGADSLGSPTIFSSTLSGYDTLHAIDTLSISSIFDMSDPMYVISSADFFSTNQHGNCNSLEITPNAYDLMFYKPNFSLYSQIMSSFLLSNPQEIGRIHDITHYTPQYINYLQYNQVFLIHTREYQKVTEEGVITVNKDSIVNEYYHFEWISPCSSFPQLVDIPEEEYIDPNGFIPVDKIEPYYHKIDNKVNGMTHPYASYNLENKCPHVYRLMDRNGNYINDLGEGDTLQVIRSGNRNMLTVPSGKVLTANNPLSIDNGNFKGIRSDSLELISAHSQVFSDEFPVINQNKYYGDVIFGDSIIDNKFLLGEDATFRLDTNYRFMGSRYQTSSIESRKDGYFEELPSLWIKEDNVCNQQLSKPKHNEVASSAWQLTENFTSYNTDGSAAELFNSLEIPSAQKLNHSNDLELTAINSRANNVLVDNFENYSSYVTNKSYPAHFFSSLATKEDYMSYINGSIFYYNPDEFYGLLNHERVDTSNNGVIFKGIAHTGEHSLFVRYNYIGSSLSLTNGINIAYSKAPVNRLEDYIIGERHSTRIDTVKDIKLHSELKPDNQTAFLENYRGQVKDDLEYYNQDHANDPLPGLYNEFVICDSTAEEPRMLDPGKYLFSVWVKEVLPSDRAYYKDGKVYYFKDYYDYMAGKYSYYRTMVEVNTGTDSVEFDMQNEVIDGWRKIEGVFDYDGLNPISIKLVSGIWGAFFDDLRIHPYDANVNTFVYDNNGRLKAKLDANNYATFYEYNEEGVPAQLKRETDQGVITISESRQSISKKAQ